MQKVTVDGKLLARVWECDDTALAELWAACESLVRGVCERQHRRGGCLEVDDLVQEMWIAFERIVMSWQGKEGSFAGYLTTSVRNRTINAYELLRNRSMGLSLVGGHENEWEV